jgi:sterol desaturase/sphingolipid hydroxylase (fatty acid hydroxylase superfamily)
MEIAETNSNFGFNLAWWDRLFGTYRAEASLPHARIRIGVEGITDDARAVTLPGMLAIPFSPDVPHAKTLGELT